jgi:hypothetical protein
MKKGTKYKEGEILRFEDGSEGVITFDKSMKGSTYAWGIKYIKGDEKGLALYLTETMLERGEIVGEIKGGFA